MDMQIEDPPPDYLNFLFSLDTTSHIPVNQYTRPTISSVALYVGKVIDFTFNEGEAQIQDFVRIHVLFDVSKRLRNSRDIQLLCGSMVKFGIDYERIHKRCLHCQRMTHDKTRFPFLPLTLAQPTSEINKGYTTDSVSGSEW